MQFKAKRMIDRLAHSLPPVSAEAFRDAVKTGDADSAWTAADMAAQSMAAPIALAFYQSGMTGAALQAPVQKAWFWSWTVVHAECAKWGVSPVAMFKACQFDIPAELPDTLTVWRGTRGVDLQVARAGLSWATARDLAIIYACSRSAPGADPRLLLRRTIPKSSLVLAVRYVPARRDFDTSVFDAFGDMGFEVIFDADPAGDVDGCEAEWHRRYDDMGAAYVGAVVGQSAAA